ncbi:P-loop containing nucleoside triphosphate hydrolase protein [Poronia punctata]|nr:P-loop containing nucleoside triphosphate hydrolase protein [Poronia punctata]
MALPPTDKIIFILGAPGSGKGTLCKKMSLHLNNNNNNHNNNKPDTDCCCIHLSVGDYLRHLSRDDESIRGYLRASKLIPADKLVTILRKRIEELRGNKDEDGKEKVVWLIDGFPRDEDSLILFEAEIGKPTKTIVLACPGQVAAERYLSRGRETMDDPARWYTRFREYERNMVAIRQRLSNVVEVNAGGKPEECFENFKAVFD